MISRRVAVDEHHAALSRDRREDLCVGRVDRAIPHRSGRVEMMLELLALNPDARLRKEIDAVEMIPMHVRDDDVRDVFRLHARARDRFTRRHEVGRIPACHEAVAVKAGIHEHVATVGTLDEPDHHRDVESAAGVGAGDEPGHAKRRQRRVANGVDLVRRRRGRSHSRHHSERDQRSNHECGHSCGSSAGDQNFRVHRLTGRWARAPGSLSRIAALYESIRLFRRMRARRYARAPC